MGARILWVHDYQKAELNKKLFRTYLSRGILVPTSQHTAVGNPHHNVFPTPVTDQQMIASRCAYGINVMEQLPSLLQTPPVISQRRAGKRPVSTDTDSILRKLSTLSPLFFFHSTPYSKTPEIMQFGTAIQQQPLVHTNPM
ncbi:hypothetical protein POM88_035878 [Heracleum sosnowskyi]|uniref:Uncharacterized protein n=1 Tax=Heracleum sosnowskyi TaxID=360622 RepID=A0AAD8HMC4_9APIA|nr:hypothetical protein POM88_035878 [Heracleum sosnowskyi]